MALSVTLDHAQKRLSKDRISALAGGLELNGKHFSNTFIDPVSNTLMLLPGPLDPAWFTSNSNQYFKYSWTEVDAEFPDNWNALMDYKLGSAAAGGFFSSVSNAPGGLLTKASLGKNTGMYISLFSQNAGDKFILIEWGYNPYPDYSASLGFRMYSDGTVEIWKNGVLVGINNISGAISGDSQQARTIDLLIIPFRKRDLLVLSRSGNGFVHSFEDIDEDDPDPIITPAEKFYVNFPSSAAQVQIAPIRYPASGYATSLPYQLAEAPATGASFEHFDNEDFAGGADKAYKVFGDSAYGDSSDANSVTAKLVKEDGSTNFVADDIQKDCRLRVDFFSGSGASYQPYSPFVYAASVAYQMEAEHTDDSEAFALDEYLTKFSLDVPDQASGVTATVEVIRPEELEESVAALREMINRPVKVELGDVLVVDGQTESPAWQTSTSDATQRLTFEFRDHWQALENYMFRERFVLDGMNLSDAIRFLVRRCGLGDNSDPTIDLDIEAVDFTLPEVPDDDSGEPNLQIEIGDTAAEWIERLVQDYAGTYHYGFEPTTDGVKFVFKSPLTLDDEDPVTKLYLSRQEAIDDGVVEDEVLPLLIRSAKWDKLKPEALDVRVTGYDRRLRRTIQSHYPDNSAMDPALAPSARPDNWLGHPLRYGLIDPAITTQEACDRACTILFERLSKKQELLEIECEFLIDSDGVPIWRGRKIEVEGEGVFRIKSLSVDTEKEPNPGADDDWQWRPARYCMVKVA